MSFGNAGLNNLEGSGVGGEDFYGTESWKHFYSNLKNIFVKDFTLKGSFFLELCSGLNTYIQHFSVYLFGKSLIKTRANS